jgi:hypothetical protein
MHSSPKDSGGARPWDDPTIIHSAACGTKNTFDFQVLFKKYAVIPAAQEAEIRLAVQGQPGLIRPHLNKQAGCSGACLHPPYIGRIGRKIAV